MTKIEDKTIKKLKNASIKNIRNHFKFFLFQVWTKNNVIDEWNNSLCNSNCKSCFLNSKPREISRIKNYKTDHAKLPRHLEIEFEYITRINSLFWGEFWGDWRNERTQCEDDYANSRMYFVLPRNESSNSTLRNFTQSRNRKSCDVYYY